MDRHEHDAFYEVTQHMDSKTQLIADPSTEVSSFTADMMRHATCPIAPIESLAELGKGKELDEALAMMHAICNKPFVITLGELGSLIYDGNNIDLVAPLTIQAVDTLGAGDIYRGAFAFGRLQGWSLARCASYANVAAALQCTKLGNATAVPSKEAIEAKLLEMPAHHLSTEAVATHFAALSGAQSANTSHYKPALKVALA
jgi:sugar/nucleoside kinase (ribokinase family)